MLRFERDGARTRLAALEQTPPFHVQRLLYLDPAHPGLATLQVLSSVAGLFAGDRLEQEIVVGRCAAVAFTTPTVIRAFAMPVGHAECSTHVHVEDGGYAEILPEPLLLCADAAVKQRFAATVDAGGRLVWGEVLALGRAAFGESMAFRSLDHEVVIEQVGQPVMAERLQVRGDEAATPGLFGDWNVCGRLNLIADARVAERWLPQIRAELAAHDVWGGASLICAGTGIGVLLLAHHSHTAQNALRRIAMQLRSLMHH